MTRLIVAGPVPPPTHGVTVSTTLILANPLLAQRFGVEHLDTSDHRTDVNIGRWDLRNIVLAVQHNLQLARRTRGEPGVFYFPLSQSTGGFLRDSLLIATAARRGWKIAGHLRGSEFALFYERQPSLLRAWTRRTLGRLDAMAVMGESLRGLFDGLVPSARVSVVRNGTPDIEPDAQARRGDTVLFLSHLRRRKGVVEALEAALIALERHPSAQFLFAGDWEDGELERAARAAAEPADGRIQFVPSATEDEKRALLLRSSLLLFPPVEPEGHPRVVLEAMAAGLPIVTTNRGAIAETVVHGEGGFVLDEPRPADLADRIVTLLGDDALRERMGQAGRARYLALFTQDRADRELAAWLAEVAGAGERP